MILDVIPTGDFYFGTGVYIERFDWNFARTGREGKAVMADRRKKNFIFEGSQILYFRDPLCKFQKKTRGSTFPDQAVFQKVFIIKFSTK